MKKQKPKMFIVRKYIKANDAMGAIRKDKTTPVHDVWMDETWKDNNLADAIGFHSQDSNQDDYE